MKNGGTCTSAIAKVVHITEGHVHRYTISEVS